MVSDWEIIELQLVALGALLFLSLAITWFILYYVRLLDHPTERSSHVRATPKCGGVGIVVSFVAGVYLSQAWGYAYLVGSGVFYSLVIPVLIVASVSLADDIRELSPRLRLGVHVLAAALFLYMVEFPSRGACGALKSSIVEVVLWGGGVVWIVGMANACNFMDGIDGLAAGQGLIAAFFFAVIQIGQGQFFLSFTSLVLVVGCLGFLAFNFPPAKVFMGDVGSVSIGFILAALSLLALKNDPTMKTLLLVPVLMANFLFDTVYTLIFRVLNKEPIFKPHKKHLYQKFALCGFSQRTVTMTNYGLAIFQGMVMVLVGGRSPVAALLLCGAPITIYCYFVMKKSKSKIS